MEKFTYIKGYGVLEVKLIDNIYKNEEYDIEITDEKLFDNKCDATIYRIDVILDMLEKFKEHIKSKDEWLYNKLSKRQQELRSFQSSLKPYFDFDDINDALNGFMNQAF